MQDQLTQIAFCVAIGGALSLVVAAVLSRPGGSGGMAARLPGFVIAAGPLYLAGDYLRYQDFVLAACAAAAFAVGLYALRGWWVPRRASGAGSAAGGVAAAEPRATTVPPARSLAIRWRGASAARTALRSRMLAVVHDDRHGARPDDRSMPSAA